MDDAGVDLAHGLVANPEAIENARPEGLDDHVGLADQREEPGGSSSSLRSSATERLPRLSAMKLAEVVVASAPW